MLEGDRDRECPILVEGVRERVVLQARPLTQKARGKGSMHCKLVTTLQCFAGWLAEIHDASWSCKCVNPYL